MQKQIYGYAYLLLALSNLLQASGFENAFKKRLKSKPTTSVFSTPGQSSTPTVTATEIPHAEPVNNSEGTQQIPHTTAQIHTPTEYVSMPSLLQETIRENLKKRGLFDPQLRQTSSFFIKYYQDLQKNVRL